jgi:lysophospholipase L1-like esterase
MKKITLMGMALLLTAVGYAQPKWDSTYRPGIYELKKNQFETFKTSKKDIIFLGNSITDYFEWNEYFDNEYIRNRGIAGDVTFGVLERLDPIIQGQPKKVFILIGINDISRNVPATVVIGNIQKMADRIQAGSPKTKIYIHTLLPVNNSFTPRAHFNKDEQIAQVNEGIRKMGKDNKVTIIDFHNKFLDAEGKLEASLTYDGLHLNMKGYERWGKILKDGNYLK